MELDRISDLPGNIINQILSNLFLKDAARTSVLSKKWRYKWGELPYLVFDEFILPYREETEFVSIVDHILLLHRGPIHKFEFCPSFFDDYRAVDRWVVYLSTKAVKKFVLKIFDHEYSVPRCLFSWQSLTHLQFFGFTVKLPSTFKGFVNMKTLELYSVSLCDDVFENLVSSCPVLERLMMETTCVLSHVKINAPNLKFLLLQCELDRISFENTSCLSEVSLQLSDQIEEFTIHDYSKSSNLLNFVVQLPQIKKLAIDFLFLEYLTSGVEPGKLPVMCESLDYLSLKVDLNHQGDCLGLLCLLSISPNLTKLKLWVRSSSGKNIDFWKDDRWNCLRTKLQSVKISGVSGIQPELDFVKFMLLISPVLEEMVIGPLVEKQQPNLLKNLLCLRRASPHARIVCL